MAMDDDPLLTYVFAGIIALCIIVAGVFAPFSMLFLAPVGGLVLVSVGAKRVAARDGVSPSTTWAGVAALGLVVAVLGAGVTSLWSGPYSSPGYVAGLVTLGSGAVLCAVAVLLLASLYFGNYDE